MGDGPGSAEQSSRGRWVAAAVASLAVAALVAYLLIGDSGGAGGDDADTPDSALTVSRADGSSIDGLEVSEIEGADASELDAGSSSQSGVYRVDSRGRLRGKAEVRFQIPAELRPSQRRDLRVAQQEHAGQMWLLRPGRIEGDEYVLETDHFSRFQLRLPTIDISLPDRSDIEEDILGVRAPDPQCDSPPADLRVSVDAGGSMGSPLIAACLDTDEGRTVIRLSNKSSIALELGGSKGVDLTETSGRSLGEEFWQNVNKGLPGAGELIPGGGSGTIAVPGPATADLVVNNSAVTVDLLVALLSRGRSKAIETEAARVVEFAACAHRASQSELSFGALRSLFVECGKLLAGSPVATAGSLLFGLPANVYHALDTVKSLLGMRAQIVVEDAVDTSIGLPDCGISSFGSVGPTPQRWDPGCTGGSPKFAMEWSRWTAEGASGEGTVDLRVCDPDCVTGYYVTYPATIELSDVEECSQEDGEPFLMYTQGTATIDYPPGNPLEEPAGPYVWPIHFGCSS